jgi:HEAT repeats
MIIKTYLNFAKTFTLFILLSGVVAQSHRPPQSADIYSNPDKKVIMDPKVLDWLKEAPFSDPNLMDLKPNFSYEDWFARGRSLPGNIETLIELLEQEDLTHPSGNGMRAAYALGWIGDKRRRGVDALLRCLGSKDRALRIEATSALGRQGDATVLPILEKLLTNNKEDINVRANACIAVGRLRVPSSEVLLRQTLHDSDPFLVRCAEEALRLHGGGESGHSK